MVVVFVPVTPVTTPVLVPNATSPLLALHVPPAGVEFNVVDKPTHTANPLLAVMLVGFGFIETVVVVLQVVVVSE